MFGKMFGNLENQQREIQEKLSRIQVEAQSGDGAIAVTANGNKELINITLDMNKLNFNDKEELEDLLLTAVNRALQAAAKEAAEETQKMLQEMLPPGLGGIGNLFGK